jgi:hypothetical protein
MCWRLPAGHGLPAGPRRIHATDDLEAGMCVREVYPSPPRRHSIERSPVSRQLRPRDSLHSTDPHLAILGPAGAPATCIWGVRTRKMRQQST